MKQNLPLNYPQIIIMYLKQRLEYDNENFDTLSYNNISYEFDAYEEEEIVRIKDLTNSVVYNITKYDYNSDYSGIPHLMELLNYIECEVKFTVHQWLEYLTIGSALYSGCLIDIFVINKDKILVDVKDRDVSYVVTKDDVRFNQAVTLCLDNNTVNVTELEKGSDDVIQSDTTESILYLLNSEYVLSNILRQGNSLFIVGEHVFGEENKTIDVFGIPVTICALTKDITFNYATNNYVIRKSGNLSIEPIPLGDIQRSLIHHKMYLLKSYARSNSKDENMLARAVINIINRIHQ